MFTRRTKYWARFLFMFIGSYTIDPCVAEHATPIINSIFAIVCDSFYSIVLKLRKPLDTDVFSALSQQRRVITLIALSILILAAKE